MWIEESVDRESQQKLYVQLYGIIKGRIEKGEWPVGTLIPSEDELCKIFNVSKATVRLAVSELVRNGYLRRQQGKGTFVTFPLPHTGMTVKTWLTEDVFGENFKVTREVLAKGVRELTGEAATFQLCGQACAVPIAEASRYWFGDFLLLWKPPMASPSRSPPACAART